MNFFDFMRNTFVTNEPVWNYYGTEIYTDPVASPGRSAQFIQDYFLQGQKGDIVYELDAHHDVNIHGISPNTERLTRCRHSSWGYSLRIV